MSRSQGKKQDQVKPVAVLSAGEAAGRARHLVAVLAQLADPQGLMFVPVGMPADPGDPLIERIVLAEELISWARSQQIADIAALGDLGPCGSYGSYGTSTSSRSSRPSPGEGLSVLDQAEMEIAAALALSRRQASRRLDDAVSLAALPKVMALLRSGLIDQVRAEAISRAMTEYLQPSGDPAEDRARWEQVEENVTARAPRRTAAMLRSDVARAALSVDPDAAERRRVKARQDRDVRMFRRPDGMASIEALLDAESAAIIDNTLTLLADAQRDAAARAGMPDERTHAQRRADALTGVFTAIADGRQLRLYPLAAPAGAGCGSPAGEPGGGEPGFSEDSQYIPECFIRPTPTPDNQDDTRRDGQDDDQHDGCPSESAPFVPAAVPAWWEPPHLPRQQRRHPHLILTIHAETLAGHDDLPGELAGYGAITADAARDLAKKCGSADLVILDPAPGSSPDCTPACTPSTRPSDPQNPGPPDPDPPDPDPGPSGPGRPGAGPPAPGHPARPVSYKPRDQVIRDVIARNRTCRAPGCTRPAEQCDLDHVIPFSTEKRSCPCNLLPLCRRHHRLKTFGGWDITLIPPAPGEAAGTVEWTSPTGRRYTVPPPDQPGTLNW